MTNPEDITPGTRPDPEELGLEATSADADDRAANVEPTISASIEAPEWDAYEQTLIVQMEDDYR